MSKPRKFAPLSTDQFSPLPDNAPPRLVLGIHYTADDFRSDLGGARNYRHLRGRDWSKLAHRAGRRTHYWIATTLTPTPVATEGMRQLHDFYENSGVGFNGATLDQLAEYRVKLRQYLGADANRSHALFAEGQLPIDLEHVKKLCTDTLPWNDLDELIEWDSGMERCRGAFGRWSAAVVFPCVQE